VGNSASTAIAAATDSAVRGASSRRADTFQYRPAQDEHAEGLRDRRRRGPQSLDDEADPERPPPTQDRPDLAARDHQGGHHERVESDRRLDSVMVVPTSAATDAMETFMTELSIVMRDWLAASTVRTSPDPSLRSWASDIRR
jgi:hypothetical protein